MSKAYVIKRTTYQTNGFIRGDEYIFTEILGVCSNKETAKEHIKAHAILEQKCLSDDHVEYFVRNEHDGWIIEVYGNVFDYKFGCEEYELDALEADLVGGVETVVENDDEEKKEEEVLDVQG